MSRLSPENNGNDLCHVQNSRSEALLAPRRGTADCGNTALGQLLLPISSCTRVCLCCGIQFCQCKAHCVNSATQVQLQHIFHTGTSLSPQCSRCQSTGGEPDLPGVVEPRWFASITFLTSPQTFRVMTVKELLKMTMQVKRS